MLPNGVFSPTSSPQIAIPSDGTIYVVGKDIGGRVWTDSVIPSLVNPLVPTFTGWQDRQGVIYGQPSVTAGQDGFVYVAARSASSNSPVYITQIPAGNASTANTWINGNGLIDSDPKIASQITSEIQSEGGTIYLTALAAANIPYVVPFVESTQTFGTWSYFNQPLTDDTIGWLNGEVYIAGRDSSESIHWYDVNTGALVPGTFGAAAGVLTAGVSTATPDSSTFLINGASNSGQTLPTTTLALSYANTDPANGAGNIAYAQFAFVNSSGQYDCYGNWGSPNLVDIYDSGIGKATPPPQFDSFCTVSQVSIVDTTTSTLTTTLNVAFNPGYAGTYSIMEQVNYTAGGAGPWQNIGTLTINTPPNLNPAPTVTLTDNTQGSGYYFVGDNFTLTVTGPPNLPVSVIANGFDGGQFTNPDGSLAVTNNSGVWSTTGTWTTASVGIYAETWYVDGVQAGSTLLFSVLSPHGTSGPTSLPNSYTGAPPVQACTDITGNWIVTPESGGAGAEWDLVQTQSAIQGTSYVSTSGCGVVGSTVSGYLSGGIFFVTASANSQCTIPTETATVSIAGSSCSVGSGTTSLPPGAGIALQPKRSQANPVPTSTRTTAHYNVSYAAYIPVNNVVAPSVCFYYGLANLNIPPGPYFQIYEGDAYKGTYRATQSVVMIPGASHNYPPFVNTGATRNYGAGSPSGPPDSNGPTLGSVAPADIYNGNYTGSDEDTVPNDCYKWNNKGQAPTTGMGPANVVESYGLANSSASVIFSGSASNPLEPLSPPISWNLIVTINESNPAAPTAQVSGSHTCYPAHTVKVNGTVVYDSQDNYGMPALNTADYLAACLLGPPLGNPFVQVGISPVQVNLQ